MDTNLINNSGFLKSVYAYNKKYNCIIADKGIIRLVHYFWSWKEICSGIKIKDDWDIPNGNIPFYGDWHDVICINDDNGRIEYYNDSRRLQFMWMSIDDFLNNLKYDPIENSKLDSDESDESDGCIS